MKKINIVFYNTKHEVKTTFNNFVSIMYQYKSKLKINTQQILD